MTGHPLFSRFLQSAGSLATSALLVFLALPVLSHGQAKGTTTETLDHLGGSRTYLQHLPSGKKPSAPLPLIVALHGATMNGRLLEGQTELSKLSDSTGEFAVVYPNADPKGGSGFWDFFSPHFSPIKYTAG